MTTLSEVEAWKRVATDPTKINLPPVKIQGIHPIDESTIIRLLITREHASDLFGTTLFGDLDVLITSATCWDSQSSNQLPMNEALYRAHLTELLSRAHQLAAFPMPMGTPGTEYRLVLIDESQKPKAPTPLQAAHLMRYMKQ